MYVLEEFQEKAVKSLLDHTYTALDEQYSQTPVLLESPTGSGKTVMIAHFLQRLVDELPHRPESQEPVTFIWFAPNTLHIQSYESLMQQFDDTKEIRCLNLANLSNNPKLHPNELLFINWGSVNSESNIWRKENETNTNLETLVENTKLEGTRIILLIDEAHDSAFTGKQAIAVRHMIEADVEVLITATGDSIRPRMTVSVPRKDVINSGLIKKSVRLNIGLDPEKQENDNVHIHLLRTAFEKKEELQRLYDKEMGEGALNPLILVQLPSDNISLSEEDKGIRETVTGLLNAEYGITQQNGRLGIWLSGERDKDGLEENNAIQDVLIFKQAIAQGWNCPRASILVSYRPIQSKDFGVQTVGRILRMPERKHYTSDALNYGYVYTDIQTTQINLKPSDSDYFYKFVANRRDNMGWTFDMINSATIINDRPSKGVLTSVFDQKFYSVMENRYGIKQLPDIDLFTERNIEDAENLKEENRLKMIQNGWEFEIDDHQIRIPTNMQIDVYDQRAIQVLNENLQDFAVTTAQFGTMLNSFCYDSITRLNRSKSWKKLRQTLIQFAEYYLGMFEFEARKFLLFPQNKTLLQQHIQEALESFDEWQKSKGNERKRIESTVWEVPNKRFYTEHFNRQGQKLHALEPFFEYNKVSTPEAAFKNFLNKNEESIEWWYKNGDSGVEHFAVPYEDIEGNLRSFFVDFIIHFKNGSKGLFDTKTKRSDNNAPNKHNALIEFIEEEEALDAKKKYIGGVLIEDIVGDTSNWRFSKMRIENTIDLNGWHYLNPIDYK